MISAVDTIILLDLARPNPDFVDNAVDILEQAAIEGGLVICPVVYAELAANFPTIESLNQFLAKLEISRDPFSETTTWQAGQSWLKYRKTGGKRERIISDFLIGAHAQNQAGQLLTRDRGFYRNCFTQLKIIASPADFNPGGRAPTGNI